MARTKRTLLSCLALAAAAAAWIARRPPPQTGEERTPSAPAPPASDAPASGGATATAADVSAVLARVFAGAVTSVAADPTFLVADFNGDGSEDVVVNVRAPAPRLAEVNDTLANWAVQDVGRQVLSAAPTASRIVPGERLLAVIHGHGPRGWRSGEARQAYLLRNAPAIGELRARTSSFSAPRRAGTRGRGDVLVARGERTESLLFFNGARYSMSP